MLCELVRDKGVVGNSRGYVVRVVECVGRSSPTTSRPTLSVTVASDDVAVAEYDHLTTESV